MIDGSGNICTVLRANHRNMFFSNHASEIVEKRNRLPYNTNENNTRIHDTLL